MSKLCDDLRASVLQAAIQGRLTDQRPEDGDARDLLAEMMKEKERLIAKKKIKKEKTLDPIDPEDVPFQIPENWVWCRLGSIVNIRSASRVHQSDWRKSGVPFYRAREIVKLSKDGFVDNELYIDEALYMQYKENSGVPVAGDLMVSGVGTLGATYIVKEQDKFYYKDASVLCFENFGNLVPTFLKIMLETPFLDRQINSSDAMGTTVATLTMDRANPFLSVLPPLAEQHRIVARVEELMTKINELEKIENKLEELKAKFPKEMRVALLVAAISGHLSETKVDDTDVEETLKQIEVPEPKKKKKAKDSGVSFEMEEPFDIPDAWKWVKLERLAIKEISRGKSPVYDTNGSSFAFAQKCNSKYNGIQLDLALRIADSSLRKYSPEDKLQEGDIVINSTGNGTLGRIGVYSDADNVLGADYYPDSHVTPLRISPSINKKYIFYCLNYYQPYLERCGAGSTNQTELKPDAVKNLLIPLPPVEEQDRIVEKLDKLIATVL